MIGDHRLRNQYNHLFTSTLLIEEIVFLNEAAKSG
jgi:hypothetical protein